MMPRHRKECGPKHGALRREPGSRRSVLPRVQVSGPPRRAGRRPSPRARRAPPAPAPGALAAGDPVVRRGRGHRDRCGAGGGFADRPHLRADLSHRAVPRPRMRRHRRSPAGPACDRDAWRGPEGAGPADEGRRTGRPGRAARGRLLSYQIVRRWPSGFLAVITIPRAARAGAWSLSGSPFRPPALTRSGARSGSRPAMATGARQTAPCRGPGTPRATAT